MRIRMPHYYHTFSCIAGKCPDSCCKEWDVTVDPVSAQRYLALSGPLGDRLRAVLVQEDGEYVLRQGADRRCPMWRQDGLCRIQAELGEEGLCQVCHAFPRLRHDYGSFAELGLELSCPEAARLILEQYEPRWEEQEIPGDGGEDWDPETMELLLSSREQVRALIADRRFAVNELLAILLLYSYDVDEGLNDPEWMPAVPDGAGYLRTARELARPGDLGEVLAFYKRLEILNPAWLTRLDGCAAPRWGDALRPLIRYYVDRYWLQAVSDGDLAGRGKFIVLSCLVTAALGGELVIDAQQYSKEIENDADNVNALLDGAFTTPAFADTRLLGLLL